MASRIRYNADATLGIPGAPQVDQIEGALLAARDEMFGDVELLQPGSTIPDEKVPLDAGFINLPSELLAAHGSDFENSQLGRIEATASELRSEVDRVLFLGIGGSYMGARALFEALLNPYHNELSTEQRKGVPRYYFQGNNLDNDETASLLELLTARENDPADFQDRWGLVVISKSGGTLETAVAFRIFRDALERFYGDDDAPRRFVVPITGETGKLRDICNAKKYDRVFPIPDNVGGRFSIFTPVGLLPAAIMGLDVKRLLEGAADVTEQLRTGSLGDDPVLDYVATCHLTEVKQGLDIRVLSTWGSRLEALGLWYDQLLAESLGKQEQGATPLTVVNTRDLHSRGQQHQEGRRDKLITNVIVESSSTTPLGVPQSDFDQDNLNRLGDKTIPTLLEAAIAGTNQAYADEVRPTADIVLPRLDEYAIGQVLQMLMLATVLEGRLIGINPYGQPGVEAYKKNMTAILNKSPS